MESFFKDKKRVGFLIAAILFVVVLSLSIAASCLIPKTEIITPPGEGGTKGIVRSYTDDSWYLGNSKGEVIKMTESGKTLATFSLPSKSPVYQLYSEPALGYIVAIDEKFTMYAIEFLPEGGRIVAEGTLSGGCFGLTADEDYVYVLSARSRFTALRKYDKQDFTKPVAQGLLYTSVHLPSAGAWSLVPIYNANMILFEAVGESIYLFTEGGVGYQIANDFSMNAFDWMSSKELMEQYGATMSGDGSVTIPEENFREEAYRSTSFSYATYSAVYDRTNDQFYMSYANKRLYTVDRNLKESSYIPIEDVPGKTMFLHEESGRVFFNYKLLSKIGVCQISGEKPVLTSCTGDFDISSFVLTQSGGRMFYLYSDKVTGGADTSAKILKSSEIGGGLGGALVGLSISGYCVSVVLFAAAVTLGVFSFKNGSLARAKAVAKAVLKNWVTYLIVFASLGSLALFTYYPGFSSLFLSFFEYTKSRPTMQWNNAANYAEIFSNPYVGVYFRNLIVFLVADIFLALLPPIIFAVCLIFIRNKRFSTVSRILLYIPGIIPSIASLLIWTNGIYGLDGLLNAVIGLFGGEETVFLQQPNTNVFWLIMMGFPFVGSYLVFYGGLMNVSPSYYEAAALDGCPIVKRIFLIDVPLVTPQIKYVFVLTFISSVQNFTRVRLTTDGLYGSQVIMNVLYNYLSEGEYGISAAYGAIMFVILMIATLINLRMKTVDAEG